MTEEKNAAAEPAMTNTDLAFERTVLAENRTLMAWIRTAISLISFGFTIYKFFHEISQSAVSSQHVLTPRRIGIVMIIFGLLSLLWGLMEHRRVINKLRKSYPSIEVSRSTWLAVMVLVFGLILLGAAFFRQ